MQVRSASGNRLMRIGVLVLLLAVFTLAKSCSDSGSEPDPAASDISIGGLTEITVASENPIGGLTDSPTAAPATDIPSADSAASAYSSESLEDLYHVEIFAEGALEHIFYGSINRQGNASGFHHEGMSGAQGHVIEGTRSDPDDNDVYEAKVMVGDIAKTANRGYSTFFPMEWSAQEVVDAINRAYEDRELVAGNTWSGIVDGMEVQFYLTEEDLIISAFPIVEED